MAPGTAYAAANDIQDKTTTPVPSIPSDFFLNWSRGWSQKLVANAQSYIDNRARRVPGADSSAITLKKVLNNSNLEFLAANPGRFVTGGLAKEGAIQHIVIHRPGSTADTKLPMDPVAMDTRVRAYTWMGVVSTFANPPDVRSDGIKDAAAAHFVVNLEGHIIQMIDLEDSGKHVGDASGGVNNQNSVGIEVEGAIEEPVTRAALDATAWVTALLIRENGLYSTNSNTNLKSVSPGVIQYHSDLSSDRHDPGPRFVIKDTFELMCNAWLNGTVGQLPVAAYQENFVPDKQLDTALASLLNATMSESNNARYEAYSVLQKTLQAAKASQDALSATRDQYLDWAKSDKQKEMQYDYSKIAEKAKSLDSAVPQLNEGVYRSVRYNFGDVDKDSDQKPFTWMDGKQV